MRHWTIEERARQAEMIRRWEPWKNAGVKTTEGKAISSRNATKHGAYSADVKAARKQLRECRRALAWCEGETES
jgi:hypothetical protein